MATSFVQNGHPVRQERLPLTVKNGPFAVKNGPFTVIAGLTRNLLLKAAMSNNRLSPGRLVPVNQPEEQVC